MLARDVENICSNLSPLLKNTIRSKLLRLDEPPEDYGFGEALVFFVGDWLSRVKLLSADQLRLVLEEFRDGMIYFGNQLALGWKDAQRSKSPVKRLPVCKLGFLDRKLACMDGRDFFIELATGNKIAATDARPLETVAYNLTSLFIRYDNEIKRSKSHDLERTTHEHRSCSQVPVHQG